MAFRAETVSRTGAIHWACLNQISNQDFHRHGIRQTGVKKKGEKKRKHERMCTAILTGLH